MSSSTDTPSFTIPTEYAEGYAKARLIDPEMADCYVEHTMVGDPLADAVVEALEALDPAEAQQVIQAGMDQDADALRQAPDAVRELFAVVDNPPSSIEYDPRRALPGMRAFHRYSDIFFVGLVLKGVISGFSTGVSKIFYMRGRTLSNLRRVKQNTRHLVEITLPDGLDRQGDGWKLSVRIRIVHAQIRRLALTSGEWDVPADGIPVHAAHCALAATGFSAVNLAAVRQLGYDISDEETDGFMHIWRYASWLMGIPETILFDGYEDAIHTKDIGQICEPQTTETAIALAHGNISVVPDLMGITNEGQKKRITSALFRTSRALLGNEMADHLEFPKQTTIGALAMVRMQRRLQLLLGRLPGNSSHRFNNFSGLLQRSVYDDAGISYTMPDALIDAESRDW